MRGMDGRTKALTDRLEMVRDQLLWWWYRIRWWTPEGKACRALRLHGRAVYCDLRRQGIGEEQAEEATLLAFEVLHQQYRLGAKPVHVREVALIVARAAANGSRIDEAAERANARQPLTVTMDH
jgi:hypothetical protein